MDAVRVTAVGSGQALRAAVLRPASAGEVAAVEFAAGDRVSEGQAVLRVIRVSFAVPERYLDGGAGDASSWQSRQRAAAGWTGRRCNGMPLVDDAIAFCGGADFTRNRWDTPAYADNDFRRRTADGRTYTPRHEVKIAVDGEAARALGDVTRQRWSHAIGVPLEPCAVDSDPWPKELHPDLVDATVGIARTMPVHQSQLEVREIEALYLRAVAALSATHDGSVFDSKTEAAEVIGLRPSRPSTTTSLRAFFPSPHESVGEASGTGTRLEILSSLAKAGRRYLSGSTLSSRKGRNSATVGWIGRASRSTW